MTFSTRITRPTATALSVALVWCGLPPSAANAAFVPTEALIATANSQQIDHRAALAHTLAREDVRAQLLAYGVNPGLVDARIAALTDAEVRQLTGQLDALPAGGDGLGVVILVLLVLVFTDLIGLTDVFPGIRPAI